jgi:hypothetical protein
MLQKGSNILSVWCAINFILAFVILCYVIVLKKDSPILQVASFTEAEIAGLSAKTIAALMVMFYLVCVPVSLLNELNHFAVLLLSSSTGYLTAFKADQFNALVMFFLELRKYGTFITQFFSFWVLLLGYLVFKSGFLPRILGILLMLGGLCYTVSAVLFFLFPNSATRPNPLLPTKTPRLQESAEWMESYSTANIKRQRA